MEFIYEMHCHTAEVSSCGNISADEIPVLYKKEGYSGIVITDHMVPGGFRKETLSDWHAYVDRWLTGYRLAKKQETDSFRVLLGAELRFPENNNDYLVYGISEEFLYTHPYINRMSAEEFSALAHRNRLLFVQAHPFRNDMTVTKPELLDGYEIYNGNKRHDSRNGFALAWADTHKKTVRTSGSDFHEYEDLARGGTIFTRPIAGEQDLCLALRTENYTFRKTE